MQSCPSLQHAYQHWYVLCSSLMPSSISAERSLPLAHCLSALQFALTAIQRNCKCEVQNATCKQYVHDESYIMHIMHSLTFWHMCCSVDEGDLLVGVLVLYSLLYNRPPAASLNRAQAPQLGQASLPVHLPHGPAELPHSQTVRLCCFTSVLRNATHQKYKHAI